MKPLLRKIASETVSTVKTSKRSIYRESDIAEAKIHQQQEPKQDPSRSLSADPRKKLQKIGSTEKSEENDSEEKLQLQLQQAHSLFPEKKRFQQCRTMLTSKVTEAG